MQLSAERMFHAEKKIWCKGPNKEVPRVLRTAMSSGWLEQSK